MRPLNTSSTRPSLRTVFIVGALCSVLFSTWYEWTVPRQWQQPLRAIVYPINLSGSAAVQARIDALQTQDFTPIVQWLSEQARPYSLAAKVPLEVTLGPAITTPPPLHSNHFSAWSNVWWSLKMRLWGWLHTPWEGLQLGVSRAYVVYHDAESAQPLPPSLGMSRGMMSLVHLHGDPALHQRQLVVIAHELLHTVGAHDKYDRSGLPVWPHGFANPSQTPRFPQRAAEIMAGRIALSHSFAAPATTLAQTRIGEHSAREIGWLPSREGSFSDFIQSSLGAVFAAPE